MARLVAAAAIVSLLALPLAAAQVSVLPGMKVPAAVFYIPGGYDNLEAYSVGKLIVFTAREGDSYSLIFYNPETQVFVPVSLPGRPLEVMGDDSYTVVYGDGYLAVYRNSDYSLRWSIPESYSSVGYNSGIVAAATINPGTQTLTLRVFDAFTGDIVLNKTFKNAGVNVRVGVSSKGHVAIATDKYIYIIAPDGHLAGNVSVENLGLLVPARVDWSPDASMVSVLYNMGLIVLDDTGLKLLTLKAEEGAPRYFVDQAWSPTSKMLAVAFRYGLVVYDFSKRPPVEAVSYYNESLDTKGSYYGGLSRLQWDPQGKGLLLAVLGSYDEPVVKVFNASSGKEVELKPSPGELEAHPSWAGWMSDDSIVVYTGYYGVDRWVDARHASLYDPGGKLVSSAPLSYEYAAVAPSGGVYDVFAAYSADVGIVVYGWGRLEQLPAPDDGEYFAHTLRYADGYAKAVEARRVTFQYPAGWATVSVEEAYATVTAYKLAGDMLDEARDALLLKVNITFTDSSHTGPATLKLRVSGGGRVTHVYYALAPGDANVKYAGNDGDAALIVVWLPTTAPGSNYTVIAVLGGDPVAWTPPPGDEVNVEMQIEPSGGGQPATTTTPAGGSRTTTTSPPHTTIITTISTTGKSTTGTPIHTLETATAGGASTPQAGYAGTAGVKGGGKSSNTLLAAGAVIVIIALLAIVAARR